MKGSDYLSVAARQPVQQWNATINVQRLVGDHTEHWLVPCRKRHQILSQQRHVSLAGAYFVSGPAALNSLSQDMRHVFAVVTFKQHFKTELCHQSHVILAFKTVLLV